MAGSTARVTQVVVGNPKETLTGDEEFKSLATTVQSTMPEYTKQETLKQEFPVEVQSNGVVQHPLSTAGVEAPSTATVGTPEVEALTSTTNEHLSATYTEFEENSIVLASDGSTLEKETEAPLPTASISDDVISINETPSDTIESSPDVGTLTTINSAPEDEESGDNTVYDPESFIDRVLTTFDETVGEVGHGNLSSQDTVNLELVPPVITVSPTTNLESPIYIGLKKVIPGLNFTNVSTSTKPSTSAPTTLEPDVAEGAAAVDTPLLFSFFGSYTSTLLAVMIGFGLIMG